PVRFRVRVGEHQEADKEGEDPECRTGVCHRGRESFLDCGPNLTETEFADVSHHGPGGKHVGHGRQEPKLWIDKWKLKISPTQAFRYLRRWITFLQLKAAVELFGGFAVGRMQK